MIYHMAGIIAELVVDYSLLMKVIVSPSLIKVLYHVLRIPTCYRQLFWDSIKCRNIMLTRVGSETCA